MEARVIVLILHLFNCWFVWDSRPPRKIKQLSENFILEELESDREGK